MTIETNDIFEALNLDSRSRFLKPFERMELHKEVSNRLNEKKSVLRQLVIDKCLKVLAEDRMINKRTKRKQ